MRFQALILLLFVFVLSIHANGQTVNGDVAVTDEEIPVSFSVVANDTDPNGIDPASVDLDIATDDQQISLTTTEGVFTVDAAGVVTFTPALNYHGVATITYSVKNTLGEDIGSANITVTVNSVNDAPVAFDDAGSTAPLTPVTVNVTSNDVDVDGSIDASSVTLLTSGSSLNGTFEVIGSGQIRFTPALQVVGSISIQYTVQDNNGAVSNPATLTITFTLNPPPVANNDAATTDENIAVDVNILSNDTDNIGLNPNSVDLDPSTDEIQTSRNVTGGSFSVAGGVLTFTPTAGFNGSASVTYTVNDILGATSNIATVTVTINPVNTAPVATNDATTTNEDTAINISILSNDTDDTGLDITSVDLNPADDGIQQTTTGTSGLFTVNASGQLTYTPAPNYNGTTSVSYTVKDTDGLVSNVAIVTVVVNAVNDAPVANNDAASTNQGVAVAVTVVTNDTDDNSINPSTVDLNVTSPGIQNSTSVDGVGNFSVNSAGMVTFSPVASFSGTASTTYTVMDNEAMVSNVATLTIEVIFVNQKPVANNDGATTNEDVPVSLNVVINDTDDGSINPASVDLNTSSTGIQSTATTAAGAWSVNNGVVTFTPALNYNGTATLSYTVSDNLNEVSNSATITITVNPVNDAPVANADLKTTNEDIPVTINLLANDTDVDNVIAPATLDLNVSSEGVQSTIDTPEGNWSVNGAGVLTYTPTVNYFGTATLMYTVKDEAGATSNAATITITVLPVNDPPIANNDQPSTSSNQQVTFNVLTNDIDVDGSINPASVDLDVNVGGQQTTRTVSQGTFTVDNAGNVTFVPVTNFSGSAIIRYTVNDNNSGVSNQATITVLVNFVNVVPVANNDAATTNEDTPVSFNIIANDTDDGTIDPVTVDLNTTNPGIQSSRNTIEGAYVVNGSGVVTFTPALNFHGTATLSYTVNDNVGSTSNEGVITITVNPVNDAPVAVNDNVSTNEDVVVNINVIANDTDVDGTIDPASVDIDTSTPEIDRSRTTAQGLFTVNAETGIVTFTPVANFNGSAVLTYNVKDDAGLKSNNATITVTVIDINDPPSFNVISDIKVLRNSVTTNITITGISPGPQETEQVLLSAASNNTPLIPHPVITYSGTGATATLSFKPQLNQSGTAEITVKAVDTGLTEFTQTFVIKVLDARITSTPVIVAIVGEPYQSLIEFTVEEGEATTIDDGLNLFAAQKPGWVTFTLGDARTAALTGTPTLASTSGEVTIQLRDGATVIDEQKFMLLIKQRPVVADIELETNEDVGLPLPVEKFIETFTDPDNDPLTEIVITQFPTGTLTLNGVVIDKSQPVTIPVSSISNVVYIPVLDFNGEDSFHYKAGDEFTLSANEAEIKILINPVNDSPVVSIESEPMKFDIGRELAQAFTQAFNAVDTDGDDLVRAEIGFRRPNFDEDHDVLEFSNTAKIKGSYDNRIGILSLTGNASAEEYSDAIRQIKYNFINIGLVDNLKELTELDRTIYVKVNDGTNDSGEKERLIELEYTHTPLDIPNVFTPDAIGNRVWKLREKGDPNGLLTQYDDAIITVFNKHGRIVFESIGFEKEWDGTYNGNPLPVDSYFYTIDLKYGRVRYKGVVTILRKSK